MIMSKKLTDERLREIAESPLVYDEDCPPLTEEQLQKLKPRYPHLIPIDSDVFEWLQQSAGENYRTKANALLRQAMAVAADIENAKPPESVLLEAVVAG